jgi:GTP-binding protein
MDIESAVYVQSNTQIVALPKPDKAEYAFIGRSNVGKSSLINMLTGVKGLAKISGRPGKTITINHFLINNQWYLVDLPGYGYARRSKTERERWPEMLRAYLTKRKNLVYTFILLDLRLEPQAIDLEFIQWMGNNHLPMVLVFTKADKLGSSTCDKNLAVYKKTLLQTWEELPPTVVTSAVVKTGRSELLSLIEAENLRFGDYISSIIT